MPTYQTASIDAIVFFREIGSRPLYLLLHRAPHKRYAGLWRIVVGKIDAGEHPVATAMREVREETGLHPTGIWSLDYVHTFYDPTEDAIQLIPVFAVEVSSTQITLSEEHDASRWVTFEQAMDMLKFSGQREALRRTHEDVVTPPDRGAVFRVDVTHG